MKTPAEPCWVVDVSVASTVSLQPAEPLPRADFFDALWAILDDTGLCGVHEGTLDSVEAFAAGITDRAIVIDAAAGDPDRDWVAALDVAAAALWFTDASGARAAADRLAGIDGCTVIGIRREEPRDWEGEFRAGHEAIEVAGFGTIIAPWEAEPATTGSDGPRSGGATRLVIDGGIGFGTGMHATTRLCLAEVALACPIDGAPLLHVLDLGSGSGILGIAAAVRGARAVDSVEVDARVHGAIRHNARLNNVADRLRVAVTLADLGGPTRYDLVLANIVAPVLLAHAGALCSRVGPGGALVLSGLLAADVAEVSACYRRLLDVAPTETILDGWHCLRFGTR
jgi:ribosomal protein L11 methyltransferase